MDRSGADFFRVVEQIKSRLGSNRGAYAIADWCRGQLFEVLLI